MATELEAKLDVILNEKTTKIIPENIKKGVTILGVDGILEDGLTEHTFEASEITLENTISDAPINNFVIAGRSRQKGTPSLDAAVPVENQNAGNTYSVRIKNAEGTLVQQCDMQLTNTIKGRADVRDTFMDDGLHIRMGELVFDGSDDENWAIWSLGDDTVERFYINADAHLFGNYSMCDKLSFLGDNSATEHFRNSSSNMLDGTKKYNQLVIYINKSRLSSVDVAGLKAYLATNPLTFTTALQEEIIVPYTAAQQAVYDNLKKLKTCEDTTIITNNYAPDGPMFSGTYYTIEETGGIDTSDATATVDDITEGKTAYVNGELVTGTLYDLRTADGLAAVTKARLQNTIGGYDSVAAEFLMYGTLQQATIAGVDNPIYASMTQTQMCEAIGLTADKIKSGETILGIEGTYIGSDAPMYTALEYIEGTGTQYTTLDYTPNQNTKLEITVSDVSARGYDGDAVLFGETWGQNRFMVTIYNGTFRYFYGTEYSISDITTKTTLSFYRRVITKDGTVLNNDDTENTSMNYTNKLSVFASTSGGAISAFKLYDLKIYENDELLHHYVPAKDVYGKVGLYDIVNNSFCYGNDNFVAGTEI